MKNKSLLSCLLGLISAIILVCIDQYTKYLAVLKLKGSESIEFIPKILSFTYVENPGSAWGIMKNAQFLVIILSVLVIGAIIFYYIKLEPTKKNRPLKISFVLLLSGAVGNLIDRLSRKIVVDFFEVKFISFPVFNVADIYVVVSVALLFILLIFVYKEEENE